MEQKTNYPWDGEVHISVSPEEARDLTVYVRIPDWSSKNSVTVNGTPLAGIEPGKYLAIHRRWSPGDSINLHFDMAANLLRHGR